VKYLGELGYDITLMWILSHVGVQGNERTDVLANEGWISGTLEPL
jgi:ribonuclease HI